MLKLFDYLWLFNAHIYTSKQTNKRSDLHTNAIRFQSIHSSKSWSQSKTHRCEWKWFINVIFRLVARQPMSLIKLKSISSRFNRWDHKFARELLLAIKRFRISFIYFFSLFFFVDFRYFKRCDEKWSIQINSSLSRQPMNFAHQSGNKMKIFIQFWFALISRKVNRKEILSVCRVVLSILSKFCCPADASKMRGKAAKQNLDNTRWINVYNITSHFVSLWPNK